MSGDPAIDWTSFAFGALAGFAICFLFFGRKRALPPQSEPITAIELPPDLKSLVLLYRAEGRTIEAIKLVRERTGCDLRTAKYLVEHVR